MYSEKGKLALHNVKSQNTYRKFYSFKNNFVIMIVTLEDFSYLALQDNQ